MERYVPGTGFVGAGSMLVERYVHSSSLLANGSALLTGTWGWSSTGGRTAEFYSPATAVALVSTAAPDGFAGTAYAGFTLVGSGGGGGPYSIAHVSGGLPGGLIYDPNSRAISGTPTESGTFGIAFRVADGFGNSNSQTVWVRIDRLAVTTASLPNAQVGTAYNQPLAGTGRAPLTWSLVPNQGGLPAGLTLNPNGTITGTPTTVQFAWFYVRATDAVGQVAQRQLSISVNP